MANFTTKQLKTVTLVLLAGNLLFLGAMQLGPAIFSAPTADPRQMTLHAEQIQIVKNQFIPIAASAPAAIHPPESVASAVPNIAASGTPVVTAPAPEHQMAASAIAAPPTEKLSCMDWGNFSEVDLPAGRTAVIKLQLADRVVLHTVPQNNGYWVFIPPLKDKDAVNNKVAQLKAQNITDYFVVKEEGPRQNAISLGVFKTKEPAQQLLKELHDKKISGVEIGEHGKKLTKFVFRDLKQDEIGKLQALKSEFPNTDYKKFTCKH